MVSLCAGGRHSMVLAVPDGSSGHHDGDTSSELSDTVGTTRLLGACFALCSCMVRWHLLRARGAIGQPAMAWPPCSAL